MVSVFGGRSVKVTPLPQRQSGSLLLASAKKALSTGKYP